MYQQIQITVHQRSGQRKLFNAILALGTGSLALIWPNFLYYIVGGYLIALSLILLYFKVSSFLTALTALTAILIFLLPELIPYTFAFFLGVFGLTFLIMQLTLIGLVTLLFSVLILMNPGSVAYMIGAFLLLYGFIHLVNLIRESREIKYPDQL
jgi:hypothetical protein